MISAFNSKPIGLIICSLELVFAHLLIYFQYLGGISGLKEQYETYFALIRSYNNYIKNSQEFFSVFF